MPRSAASELPSPRPNPQIAAFLSGAACVTSDTTAILPSSWHATGETNDGPLRPERAQERSGAKPQRCIRRHRRLVGVAPAAPLHPPRRRAHPHPPEPPGLGDPPRRSGVGPGGPEQRSRLSPLAEHYAAAAGGGLLD